MRVTWVTVSLIVGVNLAACSKAPTATGHATRDAMDAAQQASAGVHAAADSLHQLNSQSRAVHDVPNDGELSAPTKSIDSR